MTLALLPDHPAELPVPLTSFVGRARETAEVAALLCRSGVRLVTLTGPGGVGKTRLALRVAVEVGEAFVDAVRFVALADIVDPALVPVAVAAALGMAEGGDRPLRDRLVAVLRDRSVLLVLDNVEHLLSAAPFVAGILAACPDLRVLATSRAPLSVQGEHEFPVPPLAFPAAGSPADPAGSEAVTLFVARAVAVDPGFALATDTMAAVAAVCAALDGLPLAIELAATRTKVLSPAAILTRLERPLSLLTGGTRDAPARLRTMRGAIEWSHDLLAAEERVLFRRLAVFVGGCTLDAVEAVTNADGALGNDVLDRLAALVDHSLVRRTDAPAGETRYGMLETIRAYAVEQLTASSERTTLAEGHARYFLTLAETDEPNFTPQQPAWFARLEAEQPNFRAALAWAGNRADTDLLPRLAAALWWFWRTNGHLIEGHDWLERAVAHPGLARASPATRAAVLIWTADLALNRGDAARFDVLIEEGLAVARAGEMGQLIAAATTFSANAASRRDELARAETFATEALGRWRDLGEWGWVAGSQIILGEYARRRGDANRAKEHFAEARDVAQHAGFGTAVVWAHTNLGLLALDAGEFPAAADSFRQALELARAQNDLLQIAETLARLGRVAWAAGFPAEGTRLVATGTVVRETLGHLVLAHERAEEARFAAAARAAIGEEHFASLWASGCAQAVAQAIAAAEAVAARIAEPTAALPSIVPDHTLSPRELEVLRLLVDGRSDREIADLLFLSPRTVEKHVRGILAKLDVPTRTAAATFAIRRSLA